MRFLVELICRFNFIRHWKRDERGATAIEFSFIAIPFFLMIIGMIETTLFFAAGAALEGGTQSAARIIMTGQAQAAPDPQQTFQDLLCTRVRYMVPCDELDFEVLTIPGNQFGVQDAQPVFDEDGNLVSQGFDPGGASEVVLVRVAYRYGFITPFLGAVLSDGGSPTSRLHMSTVVMRNEPYEF